MHTDSTRPPKKYQTYILNTYYDWGTIVYPKKGFVFDPMWQKDLHSPEGNIMGLERGEGNISHLSADYTYGWQVLMVDSREVVDLKGIVKVPRAWVILSGTRDKAVAKMLELGCSLCVFGKVEDSSCGRVAIVGDFGTAIVGYHGTAIAGYDGTAKAGTDSIATVGNWGTAITGMYGTATAGDNGTAIVGYHGTAIAGYDGTAKAGYRGTAIAGHGGTANAGKWGTAITGYVGTAVAGNYGTIQIKYLDAKSSRYRTATGYIGENGLLPNTKYKVDDNGKFCEV